MGKHTKATLIAQKDNPTDWTVKNTLPKGRARRAALHAQIMHCIRTRGYYVDDRGERIDEAAYRAKLRTDLHKRLSGAVIYYQVNVDRAMDIMRHGEKSRWWQARFSRHHAGGDTTGIGVWVRRFERRKAEKRYGKARALVNQVLGYIDNPFGSTTDD